MSQSTPPPQLVQPAAAQYRAEIQGLRALAASLVAIYHIWFDRVSGGVDVFFVVSGFLITGLLVRRLEGKGAIDFKAYFARIARRILPAAYTVLVVVVLASAAWISEVYWRETLIEIRAAALYVVNWQFAIGAVDYFANDEFQSPVLHFWALSVQGQFYILWPFLIGGTAWIARKIRVGLRGALLTVLSVGFVASLAWSVYGTAVNQGFTYFSTVARAWEFALGGLVALTYHRINLPAWAKAAAAWAGFLMIISTGALIDGSVMFPGYAALFPTVAACLILISGPTSTPTGALGILSSRPMVYLGDVSYSLFLWHWPVLVFAQLHAGGRRLGFLEGAAVLAVSFVLAVASTRWIETPFRQPRERSGRVFRSTQVASLVLIPVAIIALTTVVGRQAALDTEAGPIAPPPTIWTPADPADPEEEVVYSDHPGPAVFTPGFNDPVPDDVPIIPALLAARQDIPDDGQRDCNQRGNVDDALTCEFGDPDSPVRIALVGGSHSRHWHPALEAIASKNGIRLSTYTKTACRFIADDEDESCAAWNVNVMQALLDNPPTVVFTTATAIGRFDDEHTPDGFIVQWEILEAAGIPVLAIRDNPTFPSNPAECVADHGRHSPNCEILRAEALAAENPALARPDLPPNVMVLDLSDRFCFPVVCPAVAGNILIYRDRSHITATYSRALAPYLEEAIREAAPWLLPSE